MAKKLWGGRFKKRTDPLFERFSASFKWDVRLLPYDLAIDRAHVQALKKCGVLSGAEAARLLSAIASLEKKSKNGSLRLDPNAEDVHSAIQSELAKSAGALADKIHAGRSRNDLVSQSSRLYCKEHALRLAGQAARLQKAIVLKADSVKDVLVPGMTHLQNAQVVSQAHIFLAYAEMLERSKKLFEAAAAAADVCVLGSGALAGTTFALDQKFLARQLGLSRVTDNSYDVSGDRDYVLAIVSAAARLGIHLSRMAEDLMIAQTKGFALVDIDESLCTGSSMMPQKKNADFLELARGAAGISFSALTGLAVTLKGLPTSYNRDLQWDKRYLFDAVETSEEVLEIYAKLFSTIVIDKKRAAALVADESLYATDLADYLVRKGVPFKEAHGQVGRIVSFAEENGHPISKIGLDLLKKFAPKLEGDVYSLFDAGNSVRLKKTIGSTRPSEVRKQIQSWKARLKG